MTRTPSVSVVVPALNEERYVGHLLRDIERQSRRPQEVILVDMADASPERAG